MGMRAPVTGGNDSEPIDWVEAKKAIIAGLDVSAEYEALGVRFSKPGPNSKGWRECYAFGRQDDNPSAAVHIPSGIYADRGGDGQAVGLLDFALRNSKKFGSWREVVREYADRAGVKLGRIARSGRGDIKEGEYLYREHDGRVRYMVVRRRRPNGKKTFSQQSVGSDGRWKIGEGAMDGVEPLPYRLPELLASPDSPVWVVEGEKDADRLASLGLVATTNHQGSDATDSTWPRFLDYFMGRTVYVVPDNDPPGLKHARKVCGYLHGIAAELKLVAIPDAPAKGDVSDWLDTGGAVEELEQLAADAPEFDPASRIPVNSVNSATHQDADWEPPVEVERIEAVEFPLDVYPEMLAELCMASAAALQAPVDYFAANALALAGGVMGRSVCLEATPTWEVLPNLYVGVVGPPGSRKSPAQKAMAYVVWAIDRELRKRFKEDTADYRREKAAGSDPEPPVRVHAVLDDATREAVGKVHAENPRGVLVVKDELTGWVASQNQYRQGKGDDVQFWLSMNTNGPIKVTRKGSQDDFFVYPSCGTVLGNLTPDTLPQIKASKSDDGWIDRLVCCYPEPIVGGRVWSKAGVPRPHRDAWELAIRRLWSRKLAGDGDHPESHRVALGGHAEAEYERWYNRHQAEQSGDEFPESLVGPWSKMEGYCLRFALILAQLRQAYDPVAWESFDGFGVSDVVPDPDEVDALIVRDATRLADYFKTHFRRARGELSGRADGLPRDAADVLRWVKDKSLAEFTSRDVIRRFPRFEHRDRDRALASLVARRFIRRRPDQPREPGQRGQNPSPTWEVNPHLITRSQN